MNANDNVFSYASRYGSHSGLTARDYVAIQAMMGISANPDCTQRGFDEIADMAYKQADAMIKRSENETVSEDKTY